MTDSNITAHIIIDDGRKWIRILPESGYGWDEPIDGWTQHISLIDGSTTFRHDATQREYPETPF